ncbi:MAG TPA: VOC family protein [Actinomycetota bacterium]|nr:VOC family protein [Actinomycetota bacterium]
MTVGDLGTMAVLVDNGGAVIGAWQPITFSGIGVFGENGAPAWFELHTGAYADSINFYRTVFQWNTQTAMDTPEFHYTILADGDKQLAGIMDTSTFTEDIPTRWGVYITVDDADASTAQAVSLGGSVVHAPEDTPYGRLATVADPSGAQFKLLQPPATA